MEVGEYTSSTIPPFQHESYGANLARCQRYYYLHVSGATKEVGNGFWYGTTEFDFPVMFGVSMREGPTLDIASGTTYYRSQGGTAGNVYYETFTLQFATPRGCNLYNGSVSGGTTGDGGNVVTYETAAKIAFTAEL